MKPALFLTLVLSALPSSPLLAQDAAAPATETATPATPADAAWEALAPYLKQPTERPKDPKNMEEMYGIFKRFLVEGDEKMAAFRKDFPEDPRRWELSIHSIRTNSIRGRVGLPSVSQEEMAKIMEGVKTAPDADPEMKATASYMQAITAAGEPEEFRTLAEAHLKAWPDFKGNPSLTQQLKQIEKKAELEKQFAAAPLDLTFTATDGTEVDLKNYRGKVVLIDFWATWCGPCVAEIPNVVGTYNKLHDKGFEILGISFDKDKEKLDAMTKAKEMPWLQYFDGKYWENEIGQRFGVNSIPAMWLVNKKGMVIDLNGRQDLEEKVTKLLEEPAE